MNQLSLLRSWFLMLFIGILCMLCPVTLNADHMERTSDIHGILQNGSDEAQFYPSGVSVKLHVLEGISEIESYSTSPSSKGTFRFQNVKIVHDRTYFLTAEYQGAVYSSSVDQENLDSPSIIQVFESTQKANQLKVISHTVIVTGADPNDRILEILERISLENTGDKTVVASTSSGSMEDLLRFALPSGFYNLDIRSDLIGGEVLVVDRGFALTTPVPPSQLQPHHFEFVYRLKYSGTSIDLSRTLRFGADNIRVVIPTTVAVGSSNQLTDLGVATIGEQDLQLLEGSLIVAGAGLDLRLSQLPEPSTVQLILKFIKRWQLIVGLPLLLGILLGGTLIYGLKHNRKGPETIPDVTSHTKSITSRSALFDELVEVERNLRSSEDPDPDEKARSEQLKRQIVNLDVQAKFDAQSQSKKAPQDS